MYECHADFAALPTFGVIPAHPVAMFAPLEHYIPNYDRVSRCKAAPVCFDDGTKPNIRGHDRWSTTSLTMTG